jgi:hypothetical protein
MGGLKVVLPTGPLVLAWGKSLQLGVPHGARGGAPVGAFVAKPNGNQMAVLEDDPVGGPISTLGV